MTRKGYAVRAGAAIVALLVPLTLHALDKPHLPDERGRVRELRLGVVCYGGVSLAIYMYGNVREIHHLALASSALECDAEGGAACGPVAKGDAWNELPPGAQPYYVALVDKWAKDEVRTRVVVDVISGTSAGGINGIFLAKALNRNLPIHRLRGLWFTEADISRLAGWPWPVRATWRLLRKRPALRGDTWLKAVHAALVDMDQNAKPSRMPTLLAENQPLDLLVTATDFFGTERSLEIGRPPTASELRYDHVFHFSNDGDRIGFDNNVALAFAARSSASFPVAFPPIRLQDLATMLGEPAPDKLAAELFRDRLVEAEDKQKAAASIASNLFLIDGGILDNYPFSIAFRRVSGRTPALETQREFIYLEPDPRVPPGPVATRKQPKPLQVALGAATRIPGAEPIAQDLIDIAQHNRRVARIREITHRDDALARIEYAGGAAPQESVAKQVEDVMDLGPRILAQPAMLQQQMMNDAGADAGLRQSVSDLPPAARDDAYEKLEQQRLDIESDAKAKSPIVEEAYARLRVHSVLDQFARVISTELCGIPADFEGRQTSLVRELVLQWAESDDSAVAKDRDAFLRAFDLGYMRRKLRLVNDWLNMQYDPDAYEEHDYGLHRDQIRTAQEAVSEHINVLSALLRGQKLADYGLNAEFAAAGRVACVAPEGTAVQQAKQIVKDDKKRRVLNELVAALEAKLLAEQRRILGDLYTDFVAQTTDWPKEAARAVLSRYLGFPYWDRASYPYTAFSGTGDLTRVSISRFSPNDAAMVTEKGAGKLAGQGLGHFAAFLKPDGRQQDYLWGRLDGAEHALKLIDPPPTTMYPTLEGRVLQALGVILDEEESDPVVSKKNVQVLRDCVDKPKSCS